VNQRNIDGIKKIVYELFSKYGDTVPSMKFYIEIQDRAKETTEEEQESAFEYLESKKYVIFDGMNTVRGSLKKGMFFSEWEDSYSIKSNNSNVTNNINITNSNVGDNNKIEKETLDKGEKSFLSKPQWAGIGVIVAILIAVLTPIINDAFQQEKTTNKSLKVQQIQQKFKIQQNLKIIYNESNERINNLKFAIDNLSGLLVLSKKAQNKHLTKNEFDGFKIQLASMKNSFKLSGENQLRINKTIIETLKQSEIYDTYNNNSINTDIKETTQLVEEMNSHLLSKIVPIYNQLISNFIKTTKEGTVLEGTGNHAIFVMEKQLESIYTSIEKAKKTLKKIQINLYNINVKLEKS